VQPMPSLKVDEEMDFWVVITIRKYATCIPYGAKANIRTNTKVVICRKLLIQLRKQVSLLIKQVHIQSCDKASLLIMV
jgi:hypothetical protein